ncbi:hypothetical protein BN946_scf184909.g73 [Trametes cinnabarina]|uniref:FHA domain-containing protein n=1 Tax=Pycnoporus cinnabarinus TaxID=5643 RepID=A0A060SGX0_PYCCI|nr:hypothetical protein BN946_scf184909.g73 [Trametes cinnabarina]
MRFSSVLLYALSASTAVLAAPAPASKRSVTALSAAQLSSFAPFTQFARAAYCPISKVQNWQCGQACDALPGFQPTLTGGDGNAIQQFFVGYWPQQNAVVVSHEGTDPVQFESDLTDINFFLDDLDTSLFPGVTHAIQVHNGFAAEHAKTASTILAEVKRLISQKGAKQVIAIGHSLGGALAELDSLFFTLQLPSSIHVKAVTYGTPRVGNPEFAQMIDSKVPDFVRINNEKDLVPIVPGRFLGFQHPHGEIHIVSPGNAVSCPGDDDADDSQCTIKTVPNILEGNILDHLATTLYDFYLGIPYCAIAEGRKRIPVNMPKDYAGRDRVDRERSPPGPHRRERDARGDAREDYRRREGSYRDDDRSLRDRDLYRDRDRLEDEDRYKKRERGYDRRGDDERRRDRDRDRERDDSRRPGPSRRSASPRARSSQPPDARSRSRSAAAEDKAKPNFAPSGLLAAETKTVKRADGTSTVLKYHEPPEARKPSVGWRLYVFKGKEQVDRQVREKNEFGDVKAAVKPFIIDLESTNGTIVNDETIPTSRYFELMAGDVIKFGESAREYVLLSEDVA